MSRHFVHGMHKIFHVLIQQWQKKRYIFFSTVTMLNNGQWGFSIPGNLVTKIIAINIYYGFVNITIC